MRPLLFYLLLAVSGCRGLQLRDGGCQLLHGLLYDGAGRSHVEPHEADALLAEHLAVIERELGLVDEEVNQLGLRQSQAAAIEPYQEGGLRTERFDDR